MTAAGDQTLSYHPQHGLLTGTVLGLVSTSQSYTGFGELDSITATVDGDPAYSVSYVRDKLGRITMLTETLDGQTTEYAYAYDLAGWLWTVQVDGALVSTYSYDANGNRLSYNGTTASYDEQDRLQSYAGASYAYTGIPPEKLSSSEVERSVPSKENVHDEEIPLHRYPDPVDPEAGSGWHASP